MGGGDGRAGREGAAGALPGKGGTDGSDLTSRPIASVAELRAAVEPAATESGFGKTGVSLPNWGRAGSAPAAAEAAGCRADADCGTGLEAFIETAIRGTAANAAIRWAFTSSPAPARRRPSWMAPKTTARRAAAWTACRRA